jgi:hypothetical protein
MDACTMPVVLGVSSSELKQLQVVGSMHCRSHAAQLGANSIAACGGPDWVHVVHAWLQGHILQRAAEFDRADARGHTAEKQQDLLAAALVAYDACAQSRASATTLAWCVNCNGCSPKWYCSSFTRLLPFFGTLKVYLEHGSGQAVTTSECALVWLNIMGCTRNVVHLRGSGVHVSRLVFRWKHPLRTVTFTVHNI